MHRSILRIALPSIVSNITVPLLGLVDTAITGHLGTATPIAAIAIGSSLFSTTYWLFNFLRMSTGGLTAQSFGAEAWQDCGLHLSRSLTLGLGIALLLLLLQQPLLSLGLFLLHPSPAVATLATTYYQLLIWGAPAMLALFSLNGWLLGLQDARSPMWVALLQNISNILLSLLFVYAFGWGLIGVALGTLLAQWLGALLAFFFALQHLQRLSIPLSALSPWHPLSAWRSLFTLNRDIFLRTLCLVSVMFAFTAWGSRLGSTTLAVNALLLQFFLLVSYVMDGFAYAGEALGGRLYGAQDQIAFRQLVRQLFLWGIGLSILFSFSFLLGGDQLVALLTDLPHLRQTAHFFLPWVQLLPLVSCAAFLLDGLYVGLTATRPMLIGVGAAAIIFFTVAGWLSPTLGNHALWLAFLLYLLTRGAVQMLLLPRLLHNKFSGAPTP